MNSIINKPDILQKVLNSTCLTGLWSVKCAVRYQIHCVRNAWSLIIHCVTDCDVSQAALLHQGNHDTGNNIILFVILHYNDVTMNSIASQITSLTIVYSAVHSGTDQSKHQSSASLAFVRGIHRGPVNSPHKWPVTRKMFPFDDVIMVRVQYVLQEMNTYIYILI